MAAKSALCMQQPYCLDVTMKALRRHAPRLRIRSGVLSHAGGVSWPHTKARTSMRLLRCRAPVQIRSHVGHSHSRTPIPRPEYRAGRKSDDSKRLSNIDTWELDRDQSGDAEANATLALKATEANKVTWIGVGANVALAGGKMAAGILGNSAALLADAAHSWSDLYPFGFGKFESVGALSVSLLLAFTGVGMGIHSVEHIMSPEDHGIPTQIALAVAAISIVSKEVLYQITVKAGKEFDSKVVIANAWHHRSDALSSIIAVLGIGGAMYGFTWLDGAAGFVVAAMITRMGFTMARASVRDLTDEGITGPMRDAVGERVLHTWGVRGMHDLRMRRMGPFVLVDVHVLVDDSMTVSAAHQVAERVRVRIMREFEEVAEVLVHIDSEFDQEEEASLPAMDTLMRPQELIEADCRAVVLENKFIRHMSHFRTHFIRKRVAVELEVELHQDDMVLSEIREQSRLLQKEIVRRVPDVYKADVHLELGPPYSENTGHKDNT